MGKGSLEGSRKIKTNSLVYSIFLGHGAKLLRKALRCSLEVCCGGMSLLQGMLAYMTWHRASLSWWADPEQQMAVIRPYATTDRHTGCWPGENQQTRTGRRTGREEGMESSICAKEQDHKIQDVMCEDTGKIQSDIVSLTHLLKVWSPLYSHQIISSSYIRKEPSEH